MKELEKTKRISIAAVLTILVVIIALLSYKRPLYIYKVNTQHTLEKAMAADYFLTMEELNQPDQILIDVRNAYEYDRGHLEGALNLYAPEILSEENGEILQGLQDSGKILVLCGSSPNEVIAPFLLLYQVGYENVKILQAEISYEQNQLVTQDVPLESAPPDIKGFIEKSIQNAKVKPKAQPKQTEAPKQVVPLKKKKKKVPEGGC